MKFYALMLNNKQMERHDLKRYSFLQSLNKESFINSINRPKATSNFNNKFNSPMRMVKLNMVSIMSSTSLHVALCFVFDLRCCLVFTKFVS
jgi:hypothetical protein